MIDWGIGHYERTAAELAPVADDVIARAGLRRGERVLDLACGTGNAALAAARAGVSATGVDAAARLIEVARGRAAAEVLDASFQVVDVQSLPFEAGSFDVAVSVFGVIFASDANTAFAEMMRVLADDGRALISVWVPAGPIDAMVGVFGRAMAAATGPPPPRFAWADAGAVGELAARHGAEVRWHDGALRIVADSPESYFEAQEQHHPMSVAARPVLERAGTYGEVRERALEILRQGNEDRRAFGVTSPYRVIEVSRRGPGR